MNGAAVKQLRKVARRTIEPAAEGIREQYKADVEAIQNNLIDQLCGLPFRKRLRFCWGIMTGW